MATRDLAIRVGQSLWTSIAGVGEVFLWTSEKHPVGHCGETMMDLSWSDSVLNSCAVCSFVHFLTQLHGVSAAAHKMAAQLQASYWSVEVLDKCTNWTQNEAMPLLDFIRSQADPFMPGSCFPQWPDASHPRTLGGRQGAIRKR